MAQINEFPKEEGQTEPGQQAPAQDAAQTQIEKPPWWRRRLIGYLCVLPILAIIIGGTELMKGIVPYLGYPSSIWVFFLTIVALTWGTGPALLLIVLGVTVLDYYFVAPKDQYTILQWPDVIQLVPYVLAAAAITVITHQLERSRNRARIAEMHARTAEAQAQNSARQLSEANQHLTEVNQKLANADRTKDRFISIVAHELKTPITAIRGHSQLIQHRLARQQKQQSLSPNEEKTTSSVQHIEEQTDRLTILINDLLDVSRIRSGQMRMKKEPCDLNEICRAVTEEQRLLSKRTITLHQPEGPLLLQADRDRLAQVLTNLISNAVKYSSEPEPIEVSISQQEGWAVLQVRDYGRGISKKRLPHLFQEFYRTPDAQVSSIQGLGMGLAIVKEIVKKHDGQIGCESEEGQGSTFFVKLPLLQKP